MVSQATSRRWMRPFALFGAPVAVLALAAWFAPRAAHGGPYVPRSDTEQLERLPLSARDPDALELRALERTVRAHPGELSGRVALARKCIELYRKQSDPRYLGRAEAALGAAFADPAPPSEVRLLRAVLRQSNHDFGAALAELDVVVSERPGDPQPWLVRAVVLGVLGRYADAERDCERTRSLAGSLVGAVCLATPFGMTGRGEQARAQLLGALGATRRSGADERAWALSALAELETRLGRGEDAVAHFEAARALEPDDPYTLAAYADLLLDRHEPQRVVELLRGNERIDALLLRVAIAEQRLGLPTAPERAAELGARFEAARLRGDVTHRREESRYRLELAHDASGALALARANWGVQREFGDARALLEAALAAREPAAARPVLDFVAHSGLRDPLLLDLIERLKGAS